MEGSVIAGVSENPATRLAVRLAANRADRREPGYPCRISLTDSKPGDELILANYEHHPVASPYRMRFAIFVRKGEETFDELDTVPEQLRKRTLAVRAFDGDEDEPRAGAKIQPPAES